MKIFITGWQGFIGSHLTPILEKDHTIKKLVNDLRTYELVEQELISFEPDLIIHLAARTEVEQSFYEQMTFAEVNYLGTVNLIESACRLPKIPKFLFASTMEVYGWQEISDLIEQGHTLDNVPAFDENTPPNPNAPYAVAKYACEKYLEYSHRAHGLNYVSVRQTNCYGRKDNDFFVTEQIIKQMLTNDAECNLGYADPYRNFIHIDDLLDAWITIVDKFDQCQNNLFTIGPDNAVQIKQHAQNIADIIGWKGVINWNTKPKRHGEIYLLNSNNKKLTELTGWSPKVNYYDGLERTVDYWKTQC